MEQAHEEKTPRQLKMMTRMQMLPASMVLTALLAEQATPEAKPLKLRRELTEK